MRASFVGQRDRTRLAIALVVAPLLIGFPLLRDALADRRLAAEHWDMLLLFFALPWAAAAILLATGRRRGTRKI